MKKTFTDKLNYSKLDIQDGGSYKSFHLEEDGAENLTSDTGLYIKFCSWDEVDQKHKAFEPFIGKRVKITVEIIEE